MSRPNVAVIRFAQGLTQAGLAARAGVSRDTVRRLERGETITLPTARAIAAALGASLDEVFDPVNDEGAAPTAAPSLHLQPIGAAGHGTG